MVASFTFFYISIYVQKLIHDCMISCQRGLEYNDCIPCIRVSPPPIKRSVLSIIVNWIWEWVFSSRDLGRVRYFFLHFHYFQVHYDQIFSTCCGPTTESNIICLKIIHIRSNQLSSLPPQKKKLWQTAHKRKNERNSQISRHRITQYVLAYR